MERIWDPHHGTSPTSKRILQDIKKIPNSCLEIVLHDGKIVPGLANRNGHRRVTAVRKAAQKFRDDKTLEDLGLHCSIRTIVQDRYMKDREIFSSDVEDRTFLTEASITPNDESDELEESNM